MEKRAILITGASSDIGEKIISAIHDNYDLIYAHYAHNEDRLKRLKSKFGNKIVLIQDDFLAENSGKNVVKMVNEIGILPNHTILLSAPAVEQVKFSKVSWDMFANNINISLKATVNILQPILKDLVKQKLQGKIIFILTSCTTNIPPKFMTPYVTTKYALLGLMKALSAEYASKGIMVNGISPGMMETQFLKNTFAHAIEQNALNSPFGRNLLVDEIIPCVEFLLSNGSDRITGQNIVISGGM